MASYGGFAKVGWSLVLLSPPLLLLILEDMRKGDTEEMTQHLERSMFGQPWPLLTTGSG